MYFTDSVVKRMMTRYICSVPSLQPILHTRVKPGPASAQQVTSTNWIDFSLSLSLSLLQAVDPSGKGVSHAGSSIQLDSLHPPR